VFHDVVSLELARESAPIRRDTDIRVRFFFVDVMQFTDVLNRRQGVREELQNAAFQGAAKIAITNVEDNVHCSRRRLRCATSDSAPWNFGKL
jgi:hypothetical protein